MIPTRRFVRFAVGEKSGEEAGVDPLPGGAPFAGQLDGGSPYEAQRIQMKRRQEPGFPVRLRTALGPARCAHFTAKYKSFRKIRADRPGGAAFYLSCITHSPDQFSGGGSTLKWSQRSI